MTADTERPRKPPVHPLTKEQRARDAALAMQEYQAEKRAAAAKTARLREQRLARDAAEAAKPQGQAKPLKRAKKNSAS
ncbi:MAG: hypothetical protein RO009_02745 [Pseudorhodoplanes sp.]|jgi:hypothetical protein|nr:hypothetical protein [Pseudorhodoplanes sp.]